MSSKFHLITHGQFQINWNTLLHFKVNITLLKQIKKLSVLLPYRKAKIAL